MDLCKQLHCVPVLRVAQDILKKVDSVGLQLQQLLLALLITLNETGSGDYNIKQAGPLQSLNSLQQPFLPLPPMLLLIIVMMLLVVVPLMMLLLLLLRFRLA